jgi:hypothetical protein
MALIQSKKKLNLSVKSSTQSKRSQKRSRDDIEKEEKEEKLNENKEEEEEEQEDDEGSSSDEDSDEKKEHEEDSEDDDDIPIQQKKQKKSKKQETEQFSNAMNALLDTHLKAYDRKDPILARSKKELKNFENDKLEQKAKRLLLAEKKKKLTANRNKNLLPTDDNIARSVLQHEKQLKKIAQRGVIKLFNAILMTQTGTQADIKNESGLLGNSKRKELVNEISKEKFLSLVQQSGK